jgi:hypothetical protein
MANKQLAASGAPSQDSNQSADGPQDEYSDKSKYRSYSIDSFDVDSPPKDR